MAIPVSEGQPQSLLLDKELTVTIAARRPKEGEETVKLVKDAGSEGIFVKTDVTNEDGDIRSLVERSTKKFGRSDYAFNNAGIEESMTPLVDQEIRYF